MNKTAIASELSANDNQSAHFSLLTFELAGQTYGLPVTAVVQIIEMVAITRVPQIPPPIQGVIDVHGEIVPILDLRLRLGLEFAAYHLQTPIILADSREQTLALIVDGVKEVVVVSETAVVTASDPILFENGEIDNLKMQTTYLSGFIKAEQGILPLVDVQTMLSQDEREQLARLLPLTAATADEVPAEKPLSREGAPA